MIASLVRLVTRLWAVPHFVALFVVDFWPGPGIWKSEAPHTQAMGRLRLLLHLEICRRLDVLNNRVERWL